ncbi:MAG: stage III sporulation protein AD [Lachnospiraceae bacterium]|nr:stage III sporulation protein AD [Lachnospiraceae bacterium]MCI9060027.1 stage III sporulation protein AD [Lachnospiraceae bacterium]
MDILKIAVLGIAGMLLGILLKDQKKEYELFVTLGVSLCIFYFIMSKLELVLSVINRMQEYVRLDTGYIAILIKMIGITYVAEFSSNLCKDAGYQAVAGQIEMFGKLSILVISMPVLLVLLETIGEFLS